MEQLIQTRLTRSPTTSHPHGQSAFLFLSLSLSTLILSQKINGNFLDYSAKNIGEVEKGKIKRN